MSIVSSVWVCTVQADPVSGGAGQNPLLVTALSGNVTLETKLEECKQVVVAHLEDAANTPDPTGCLQGAKAAVRPAVESARAAFQPGSKVRVDFERQLAFFDLSTGALYPGRGETSESYERRAEARIDKLRDISAAVVEDVQ